MLTPKRNNKRNKYDISGIWKFKVDKENAGVENNWQAGLDNALSIAVPGSWNEQLETEDLMHYTGSAWYSTRFFVPEDFKGKRIWIRIGSADYYSKVWINSKLVGENTGGFLPADYEVTGEVDPGKDNDLVLLINNELNSNSIPQGITQEEYHEEDRMREETFPAARFDFSPYGGIHRPVYLYTTPMQFLKDITVKTNLVSSNNGKVNLQLDFERNSANLVVVSLSGNSHTVKQELELESSKLNTDFILENCRFWSCDDPYLYTLKVQLFEESECIDEYSLSVGVREIKVDGTKLLLNNKPIFLKGFGKHEDFPIVGKGLNLPLIVKDFTLMKWINANSFRTSHYPYAEEWLDYADEHGILVIDEVPAISLDFRKVTDKTLDNHKTLIRKLIERDKNHPSVIIWTPGNEPNIVGEPSYYEGSGDKYWREIFSYTKSLDDTRPATVPNCQKGGVNDPALKYSDVISMNRYYGWYENPGKLDEAIQRLDKEMDLIADKYNKPIIFTEFGADTVPGLHSISDQMFTEEYQSRLIKRYCELIESKEYTVGEHVWNFADFKTPQHCKRVVLNLKGVFTRYRDPKGAAFTLKEIWGKK